MKGTITVITLNGIVKELIGLPEGYDYEVQALDDDSNCECLKMGWEQIPYEWDGTIWCLSCGNCIRNIEPTEPVKITIINPIPKLEGFNR